MNWPGPNVFDVVVAGVLLPVVVDAFIRRLVGVLVLAIGAR